MLQRHYCQAPQKRLLQVMQRLKLDALVVAARHHVYYLSGHLTNWLHQSAFALSSDGRSWLITANAPAKEVAADQVDAYEANRLATLRQEQPQVVAEQAIAWLSARSASRIAIDSSSVTSHLASAWEEDCLDIEPELWQLRRKKDPDELELLKTAIACTTAMYDRARQIVRPGIQELEVYGQLFTAGIQSAGEPFSSFLGNDFACGASGGPARKNRAAQPGEIYILDLGPAYRGYFADNCRSFSVDRNPTDAQHKAHEAIISAFPIIESMAKPGVRCQDLFNAVDEHLQSRYGQGLRHHLGHGIGLQPHEFPHLNPRWDDVLMEGEVFAAEPGLYGPELAGGIRIENNYLVTATGIQKLIDYPMDLT